MISKDLPFNPVLKSMKYSGEFLELTFKKKKNELQSRIYRCCPEIAYKLFYCVTSKICLEIFNDRIKDKLEVVKVTKK